MTLQIMAEFWYVECCLYGEYRYTECLYAECRGAIRSAKACSIKLLTPVIYTFPQISPKPGRIKLDHFILAHYFTYYIEKV